MAKKRYGAETPLFRKFVPAPPIKPEIVHEYKVLDGKQVANNIKQSVKNEITNNNIQACLAVIMVGNNPASQVYVNNKKKACEEVGIKSLEFSLPEETTEDELLFFIDILNMRHDVNGILVQLPLPKHINEDNIIHRIDIRKDVDGFSATNIGKLWLGDYQIAPCTPAGIIELLNYYNINVEGKNCVVVGRSNIVGKPIAALLLERNATVTICHSKTEDLHMITKQADIVIAAVGKSKFITDGMVKQGAIVIDVGINRDENGNLCGDVDFENVKNKAWVSPVPGGVGPMTIAMLMKNTLTAAKMQNNKGA